MDIFQITAKKISMKHANKTRELECLDTSLEQLFSENDFHIFSKKTGCFMWVPILQQS